MPDTDQIQTAQKRTKSVVTKHNIVIVEDHPLMRTALRETIDQEPDLCVLGEADGIASGIELIRRISPDLAIIDITLVDGNGLDLIKAIRDANDQTPILVISLHDESLYAERAIRAGALGYLNKRASSASILEAVRKVLAGQIHVSGAMYDRLARRMSRRSQISDIQITEEQLSDREFEVYRMLGRGISVSDMADKLKLSERTIETYRYRIRQKLNVASSNELIARAARWIAQED